MPTTITGSSGIDKVNTSVITSTNIVDETIQPGDLAQKLTLGTAIATTSGTAHDFTGIPSWVKRITMLFDGVSISTNTTSPIIQVGSGSVLTSGYESTVSSGTAATVATTGIILANNFIAASTLVGEVRLTRVNGNAWIFAGVLGPSTGAYIQSVFTGRVTLSGTLDRVRLTTVNGTDTFDAGSINILYEG